MAILTIPLSERKAGPYTATAGQTAFSFDFPVLAAADLDVWRKRDSIVDLLTLGSHYTVAGIGEQSGGSVVLTLGALAGDIIAIDGDITKQRTSTFIGGTPFKAAYIDADLNRLAIMVQELAREVSRSIRRATIDGETGSLILPIDVTQNTILALNAAGSVIGLTAASFQGPPGTQGPHGASVLSGTGAPTGAVGNDGDFYINVSSANYDLYGPKTGGAWGMPVSLKGPAGAGSGDVLGPASATVGHAAVFAHASGKQIGLATPSGPPALTNQANSFSEAQTVSRAADADAHIIRNTDNSAAQRSHIRLERGDGSGLDYLIATLGDAANGVGALIELVGSVELRRVTASYTRFSRQVVACSADVMPALTDAVNITWDWASQQTATLSIGGNRTLNTPGNARPGATAMLALTASGAPRTLVLSSNYSLPDGVTSPLSIGAGEEWVLACWYDGVRFKAVPTKFAAVP